MLITLSKNNLSFKCWLQLINISVANLTRQATCIRVEHSSSNSEKFLLIQ